MQLSHTLSCVCFFLSFGFNLFFFYCGWCSQIDTESDNHHLRAKLASDSLPDNDPIYRAMKEQLQRDRQLLTDFEGQIRAFLDEQRQCHQRLRELEAERDELLSWQQQHHAAQQPPRDDEFERFGQLSAQFESLMTQFEIERHEHASDQLKFDAQLSQMQRNLQASESTVATLEAKLNQFAESAESQQQKYQHRIMAMEAELEEKRLEIDSWRVQFDSMHRNLSQQLDSAEFELNRCRSDMRQSQEQLSESKNQLNEFELRCNQLSEQLDQSTAQRFSQSQEITELRDAMNQKQRQLELQTHQLDRANHRLELMSQQLLEAQQHSATYREQLLASRRECDSMQTERGRSVCVSVCYQSRFRIVFFALADLLPLF